MSSSGTRERSFPVTLEVPGFFEPKTGKTSPSTIVTLGEGKQITVSESHPVNRDTGSYDAGGPFYTSRTTQFIKPGHVTNATLADGSAKYTGPVLNSLLTGKQMNQLGYKNISGAFGDKNESQMTKDGATAVSLCSPTNHPTNLGVALAESFRDGIPSLPALKLWQDRAQQAFLHNVGGEYLNYQFGWKPLVSEVNSVVATARHHKQIMEQFHGGEGRNTHRSFRFPSTIDHSEPQYGSEWPLSIGPQTTGWVYSGGTIPTSRRSLVRETHRWFEGCFTYALPSSTDSWEKSIGFGEEAEQLYGLEVTPDLLWNAAPWSWAVDWFSNVGDVIHNITSFGTAGLVMRYGYMMEESIERVSTVVDSCRFNSFNYDTGKLGYTTSTPCERGFETVTKRRLPANPFGFGIGWEGLSPTQLAITAALGLTRLL